MKDEAFCYVGLLKSPDRLPDLVKLLPPSRQSAVRKKLEELTPVSAYELASRLNRLRDSQLEGIWNQAEKEMGDVWKKVSPRVRRWICQTVERGHGNQNHQE